MPPGSNPAAMMDSGVYQPNPAASYDAGVAPSPGIWEIQQGLVESGTTHTLTEVIVTSEGTDEGFFVADGSNRPFSGLYVRLFEPLSTSVSIGDTINIQGTVDEYTSNTEHQDDTTKTLTQLKLAPNSQMTKTGTSSDALAINLGAQELSYPDSAEMYEGVLISLTDLVITATRAARGEIVVDDIIVVSDDFVDFDFTWLEPGTRFDKLTALLHFENEEYKLLPRALNDIQRSDVATGNCVPVDGYLICMEEKKNWENARKACASLGGRLVILETKEESDRVSNMVREWTDQTYWMALSDRWTEGRWAWTTGSTLAYNSAWANNEPNDWGGGEDCAEGNFRGPRQWNDAKCNGSKNFVCEFPGDGPQCVEDDDCNVENTTCQNGSCTPA